MPLAVHQPAPVLAHAVLLGLRAGLARGVLRKDVGGVVALVVALQPHLAAHKQVGGQRAQHDRVVVRPAGGSIGREWSQLYRV